MGNAEDPETTPAAPAAAVAEVDFFSEKARPFDPDVAARVLRKIDLFLMPAMVIGMSQEHLITQKMVVATDDMRQVMALYTGIK